MSTTHEVTFGGLRVTEGWASGVDDVDVQLHVYTKTGQARIATLDEAELLRLNGEIAIALQQLRVHATKRASRVTPSTQLCTRRCSPTQPDYDCPVHGHG